MRILWVKRGHADPNADAGDAIYDRKMCGPLSENHELEVMAAPRFGRLTQLSRAALHLAVPETFTFDMPETIDSICEKIKTFRPDGLVFSHEHMDRLAAAIFKRLGDATPAFVSVRHNFTSDSMASILSDAPPAAGFYRDLARRQEMEALGSPMYQGIIVVSHREKGLADTVFKRPDATLAMPGAPPPTPLNADAKVSRDLLLLGTFDWFPKARDLRRYAHEIVQSPVPGAKLYGDGGIPPHIAARMGMASAADIDFSAAIRFGVITDRFTAGHKLKIGAYLMQNCAVISFADVIDDFKSIPNAQRWIHRVHTTAEIGPIMDSIAARPADEVRAELVQFKTDMANTMNWKTSSAAIAGALERAIAVRAAQRVAAKAA